MNKKDFRRTRTRVRVSVGESVRIIRELQGHSQNELSELTGIPQSTISAVENDRVNLGVERAKVIARASSATPRSSCFRVGTSGKNQQPDPRMQQPARPALIEEVPRLAPLAVEPER